MNLRCIYCQTPFTLGRAEMLAAIVHMNEKNMNHYDAHCPRCRRANSISRQRMELFFPNWQEAARQQAAAPVTPPAASPLPVSASASTPLKTKPLPKALKPDKVLMPAAAKKPAAKPTAGKKSTAKPAAKAKPAASKSKSSAKKAPAAGKAPAKGRKK